VVDPIQTHTRPFLLRSGGSIPIVTGFQDVAAYADREVVVDLGLYAELVEGVR